MGEGVDELVSACVMAFITRFELRTWSMLVSGSYLALSVYPGMLLFVYLFVFHVH